MNYCLVLRKTTNWLNVFYMLVVALFFLDDLTGFDIKSQTIKTFVYLGFVIGSPLLLFLNVIIIKPLRRKILFSITPALSFILIVLVDPMAIIWADGAWKTQTIAYKHGHLGIKTVEFQIQDLGGSGYKKRDVEVLYLTNWFMFTTPVPADINTRHEWVKVDEDINEAGLK
jgi:hypothetical protein